MYKNGMENFKILMLNLIQIFMFMEYVLIHATFTKECWTKKPDCRMGLAE